jgi:GNAT superfamily N-acetyltransferase
MSVRALRESPRSPHSHRRRRPPAASAVSLSLSICRPLCRPPAGHFAGLPLIPLGSRHYAYGLRNAYYMVIREAKAQDWSAIWLILKEEGNTGETLTWDSARTEARARAGWMREPPGRTFVAVDDGGSVIGTPDTHPVHPGPGAHVANAGFVVHRAWRGKGAGRALCHHVLDQARADG